MNEKIKKALERLHAEARRNLPVTLMKLSVALLRPLKPEDMKDAYIALSREQGGLLYEAIVNNGYTHLVEYGTSFGISTIYLAAAARETGGSVITTELLPEKAERARKNFIEAGVEDLIKIRIGDVMQTLQNYPDSIDFLLLDGWKQQYLPLTRMLEANFEPQTLIVADNLNMAGTKQYLNYVRSSQKYISETISTDKGGTEFSYFINKK